MRQTPPIGRALPRRAALLLVTALTLTGCGIPIGNQAHSDHHPAADRAAYDAKLWPTRPVVSLRFTVAPDLASVTGHESVRFTPDDQTCELVFRAWPNNPSMSGTGAALTVGTSTVDGTPVTPEVQAAGAPADAPGTLVRLALPRCLRAGETVGAELDFSLRLGRGADERIGYDPDSQTAWFGSAFPLLSWVRGQGWTRDPAVRSYGETVTSEDFTLESLEVVAPTGMEVAGVGTEEASVAGPTPDTAVHRFRADAVRDVTVAVGNYRLTERTVSGVRVHLAVPASGSNADPSRWDTEVTRSIGKLTDAYGPFPYTELWLAITPTQSDGSEFPGAVQFGDEKRRGLAALVAHELAHQYFYALVGNNQARDPWLDESLAAFSEGVVLGPKADYKLDDVSDDLVGKAGQPMSYWASRGGQQRYDEGVYQQGGAALSELRAELGEAFDADLRDYLADNAHRIATPADFAHAFADQPKVLAKLREIGALPRA